LLIFVFSFSTHLPGTLLGTPVYLCSYRIRLLQRDICEPGVTDGFVSDNHLGRPLHQMFGKEQAHLKKTGQNHQ